MKVVAVAALLTMFGCAKGGDDPAGASDDAGAASDALRDGPRDAPREGIKSVACNGMCNGSCLGLCVGVCSELTTTGDCLAQCEGTCIGSCEGSCGRTDAGADARADRPVSSGDGGDGGDGDGDAGFVDDGGNAPGNPEPAAAFGTWTDRTRVSTASWPPLNQTGAMAYDDWRLKVVMFGGFGDKSNNLWEWDGKAGTWTLMQQLGGLRPSRRVGHALAFDSTRGKLVLYGGIDETGASNNETWEWDGDTQTWTQKAPGPVPSRWGHAMAFDETIGQIIMFGGAHRDPKLGDGELLDTWQYDPANDEWTNWTYPLPGIWPRARKGHAMAFDPSRGLTVMYGGDVVNLGSAGDLWEWSSHYHAWRERTPRPLPRTWPSARTFVSFNYAGSGQMLLLDKKSPAFLRWTAESNLWESLVAPPPAIAPSVRVQPIAAWDRVARGLVVVGGAVSLGKEIRTDTWQWTAAAPPP